MHAIIKSSFYVIFLVTMIGMGSVMHFNAKGIKFYKTYGLMALILGIGEAFYLIPRIYNLMSNNIESNQVLLENGKLVSSITIVLVFGLLYKLWRLRYRITDLKWLNNTVILLMTTSIVLNIVLQDVSSLLILVRILPFLLIGIIVLIAFQKESKKIQDKFFKYMWLAVSLSFVFFTVVELFEKTYGVVVILMLPKTIMYIWMIAMGYHSFKKELN